MRFRPNRWLIAAVAASAAAVLAGCSSDHHSAALTATVATQAPARIPVPPVGGNDLSVATALLKQGRLRWQVQRHYAQQPAGRVLSADPGSGVLVAPGTQVVLVVSRGPRPQPVTTQSTPAPAPSNPAPAPHSNGGTPSVNSPQGQRALQNSPDCRNAPPPPPGYTGPVQC